MSNYIAEYASAIASGAVTAGKWIRLWYERLQRQLADGELSFDEKKADKAIRFIETFCHHSEGRTDLLKLELWQKALISVIFGVMDKSGRRQFREVLLIIARKNGKTLLVAAILAYMLYMDGEYGAKVYCLAPKLDQAMLCYDAVYQMVRADPDLSARAKKRRSDIYLAESNSSIRALAFSAKKADGFNPQAVACDEIASWPGDAGLKQYEVMKSAFGARAQPLLLAFSTAGYLNDGVYDELLKRATAVLLGSSEETRLAPFLYIIDDAEKWNDMEELKKSNPNLGVSVSEAYLREEIAIAEGSLSKKAEFLAKYCNVKQNSSIAWMDYGLVERAGGAGLRLEDFKGCYCVGGIDLSRTTDLTACCIVIERGGRFYIFAHFFMPANKVDELTATDGVPYRIFAERGLLSISGENFVDYKDCFAWFRTLVEVYKIYPLKVGYDRYSAQYLVDDMKKYGFHMDDVFQGFNLTPVIEEFDGLMRDGVIDLGDNDLLKAHLLNAALQKDNQNSRQKLIKLGTRTRIDGTAAVIDAFTVRQKWYAEIGGRLANEKKGA